MRFFQIIRSSIFDPVFYAGLAARPLSECIKYYMVLMFALAFVIIAPLWMLLISVKPEIVDTLVAVYPDNLEVTLAGGELSINQPEPYAIANTLFPKESKNLIVFDTQSDEFSRDEFGKYETVVLLKKTFGVAAASSKAENGGVNEIRIFDYGTSTATSTLTKAEIVKIGDVVKPYVRPVVIIGGIFLFIFLVLIVGIGMLAFHLVYLLIPAVLIYLYFRIRTEGALFKTSYATALYASIPVAILSALAMMLGFSLPTFVATGLILLIAGINISSQPRV